MQVCRGCHGNLTELDDYSYNNVLNHKDIGIPSSQSEWVEAGEVLLCSLTSSNTKMFPQTMCGTENLCSFPAEQV